MELYDDVSWEEDGTPTELLQLKHHVDAAGSLGDKDDDLWRTIRVWMDAHPPGDPSGPTLTLVTTQTAAAGTAAEALRAGARLRARSRGPAGRGGMAHQLGDGHLGDGHVPR
jgi:hypothetical protein